VRRSPHVDSPPQFQLFRNRTLVQAELLSSDSTCPRQGPFAPQALPRFLTTMGLSDSRYGQMKVIYSLLLLVTYHHYTGSPRFLDQSFSMRRPQSPRRARQLLAPVSSLPTLGFAYPGRLATPISITRPNRIRLRYGSHFRLARLRRTGYPALRSLGYLSNRQFTR